MPKRLFDGLDRGLGEEIILLEGVPEAAPTETYCPVCEVLRRALRLMGRDVSYERLMGLTGAAFMLAQGEGTVVARYLTEALAAVGVMVRREEPVEPKEALAICREKLRAGRPVVAEVGENQWTVIVGLRGNDLLGLGVGAASETLAPPGAAARLERVVPALPALWLLSEAGRVKRGPSMEADEAALRRGVELLTENEAQWDEWQKQLASAEPYGPEIGRRERFVAEQLLCAGLVEARDAAAQFLAAMAEEAGEDAAEELRRAAQEAERLADLLEPLVAPPEIAEGARVAEDEVWLEERRERIAAARRQEAAWRERLEEVLAALEEKR